jgi:hypothetical protein
MFGINSSKFSLNSNPYLFSIFYLNMVDLWSKFPIQTLCHIFKSTFMQFFIIF